MGVIARQSIKGALANYLGILIGFLTTFFVVTDLLTEEEIGLTRVMVDAAMLFSGLAQLGTNASIIRFYPFFKDEESRDHGFFGWTLLLPLAGFTLFAIAFFCFRDQLVTTFAPKSPMIVDYIYYLLPITFFALYLTVFETNSNVLLRIAIPKFVREVGIRVLNLGAYLLYGFNIISLDLFVILFCGAYAVAMICDFFYLLTLGKISFRIDLSFLDRRKVREIITYTLFMTVTILAGNIPLINSLFLGAKVGLALTGVYTIASYIANIVEVPYRSLGAISKPMISQAVKDDNWHEVNRLGREVSLHQLLLSTLIFFFIWINLSALFTFIPNGDKYVGGMGVVFILGLAKIVNSTLSISTDILNFSRSYPLSLLFISILTACALWLNNLLIPLWGVNGAASATLFAYVLYFLLLLIYLGWHQRVNILSGKQALVLMLIGVLFGLNWCWSQWVAPLFGTTKTGILCDVCIRSLFFLAVSLTAVYKMKISESVNGILNKMLHRK